MESISAYSFISFINGLNINVTLEQDTFVAIPDKLRNSLNKFWNEAQFVGTELPAGEDYYSSITFEVLDATNPLVRTEKIKLLPNKNSPQWSDTQPNNGATTNGGITS